MTSKIVDVYGLPLKHRPTYVVLLKGNHARCSLHMKRLASKCKFQVTVGDNLVLTSETTLCGQEEGDKTSES